MLRKQFTNARICSNQNKFPLEQDHANILDKYYFHTKVQLSHHSCRAVKIIVQKIVIKWEVPFHLILTFKAGGGEESLNLIYSNIQKHHFSGIND